MAEENDPVSEADGLPPATRKTKEQWLEEGNVLAFYEPLRREEGLGAYDQAIRLDPNYGLAHRMNGYTLRALQKYAEALVAYDQAISLDASDADAYTGKGETLYDLTQHEEALSTYELSPRLGRTSS